MRIIFRITNSKSDRMSIIEEKLISSYLYLNDRAVKVMEIGETEGRWDQASLNELCSKWDPVRFLHLPSNLANLPRIYSDDDNENSPSASLRECIKKPINNIDDW